jgi:hypothetical protein
MLSEGTCEINTIKQHPAKAIVRESLDIKMMKLAREHLNTSHKELRAIQAQLKEAEQKHVSP